MTYGDEKIYPNLGDFDWVGAPEGSPKVGSVEETLCLRRAELQIIGGVCDAEADYSYHDYCLLKLDGAFYLLETSGCSCPSPSETWSVTKGPSSLDGIRQFLKDEAGEHGYGVTKRQHDEFMALCDKAAL